MSVLTAPQELFFTRTLDRERARKRYRALALVLHPDTETGDTRLMQLLNSEFDAFQDGTLRPAQSVPPRTSSPPPRASYEERIRHIEQTARRIINGLPLYLREALDFSIVASAAQIVARGDTYDYKEDLKAYGFRWQPIERVWYLKVTL